MGGLGLRLRLGSYDIVGRLGLMGRAGLSWSRKNAGIWDFSHTDKGLK